MLAFIDFIITLLKYTLSTVSWKFSKNVGFQWKMLFL